MILELTKVEAALLAAGLLALEMLGEGKKPGEVEVLQIKLDRLLSPLERNL